MQKSLLVFGGNGYLGSHICKYAVSQGINVISVSRSGNPKKVEAWQNRVQYVKGNASDPSTYEHFLPHVNGVIHCIAILFDSNFPRTWASKYEGSYEQMNRDTALKVCETLGQQNFVYISAERGMFFAPRYISTKREVEAYLEQNRERINGCVLRPGYMYSEAEKQKRIAGTFFNLTWKSDAVLKTLRLGKLSEMFVPPRSMHVDDTAKVAVLAALRPEFIGTTLGIEDIERTALKYSGVE